MRLNKNESDVWKEGEIKMGGEKDGLEKSY